MDPDNNRTIVKVDASIAPLPNARRQSTELAANAINAIEVRMSVLIKNYGSFWIPFNILRPVNCLNRADYLRKASKNIFPVSNDGPLVTISSTL